MLDTWLRAVLPSDDDGVTLSQTVVVVLADFTCARLRDARLAADGMFDGCTLLQYTLHASFIHRASTFNGQPQNVQSTWFCSQISHRHGSTD